MKKIIALLLVAVLTLSTATVSSQTYADTQTVTGTKSGAEELFKYGFIRGNNGDLMVDDPLTRAQACALLAEMYGKKTEAGNFAYKGTFPDVTSKDWFASYVGFAKESDWISGYPNGKFGPTDMISSQEWAAMLMRALGYPFGWNTVIDDISTLGIVVNGQNNASLTRGESFESMWKAVNTPRSGESMTLAESLGKIIVVQEPSTKPYIKSIKIESLKQLYLIPSEVLNVETAEDIKNYSVSSNYIFDLKVISAKYSLIENKITLTFNKAVPQQTDINLEVNSITNEKGDLLVNDLFGKIEMIDLVPPLVSSVQVLGNRAIKVLFTEPVKSEQDSYAINDLNTTQTLAISDFVFNSGTIAAKSIKLQKNNLEAIVEFSTDLTGTLKIEPKATIKDYANFGVFNPVVNVPIVKDTKAPSIIGYKDASAAGVTLIWDEDIRLLNGLAVNFYHTTSSNMVDSTVTSKQINGNELRLDFTRNFIPTGKTPVMVLPNTITDYSSNMNTQQVTSITLDVDLVAPVVVGDVLPMTERKIKLSFSEGLYNKNGEAQSRSNFKIFDETGKDISDKLSTVSYNNSTQSIELSFTENLKGNYKLIVSNIKDFSGNSLFITSYDFIMKDLTAPNTSLWTARVYNSKKSSQMIKIRFDEPMSTDGKYSILDVEKYSINGKSLDSLDQSLMRLVATEDNSSLEIYYPGAIVKGGYDFIPDSNSLKNEADDVVIARVADANNNYITNFSVVIDLEDKGSMEVESASQIASNEIELIISDVVIAVNPSDFKVEGNGKIYTPTSYILNYVANNRTKLVLTLSEKIVGASSAVTIKAISAGTINGYGEAMDLNAGALTLQDKVAPSVENASFDGVVLPNVTYTRSTGIVAIKFSEEIDSRTVSLLSFEVSNYVINSITVSGDSLRIEINTADRDRVSIFDSVIQKAEIRDKAGNGVFNLDLQIQKVY